MKNILIVIHRLEVGGGAERIATEVGNVLDDKGYNVIFLTFVKKENEYEVETKRIVYNKYDNLIVGIDPFNPKIIVRAKKIADICEKYKINTVISFLYKTNITSILSKTIFNNKSKINCSVRNNPMLNFGKFEKYLIKKLYPKADKVVALSEGVEIELKENFSLDNTCYIHNVQNVGKFKRMAEKKILENHKEIFDDSFNFITIGSLSKQKGQWYLLRCFKKVSQSRRDAKLIVLGEGSLRRNLEELVKKMDLEEKVFFLGNVENVFPYLKKSDCFVLSSLWEGFGNVLTEALSQDIPVISTDCTAGPREILCPELGIREEINYPYYGKYGILVESFDNQMFLKTLEEKPLSEDEKIFANSMIKIMDDQKLRNRYSDCSERVEDFKASRIIQQWEELFKK